MARPTGFFTRNGAVLLYVPNLIGTRPHGAAASR